MRCSAVAACSYSHGQDSLYQCVRGKFENLKGNLPL